MCNQLLMVLLAMLFAHELSIRLSILPTLGNRAPATTNKDRVSEIL